MVKKRKSPAGAFECLEELDKTARAIPLHNITIKTNCNDCALLVPGP